MRQSRRPAIKTGYHFENITVISDTGERKNGYTVWLCTCTCGSVLKLDTRTLQRGTVQDCGCLTKVRPGQRDISGIRFGKLVALEPTQNRSAKGDTVWKCRCDCGNIVFSPLTQLTQGYKKSCGCISHPQRKDYLGKRFGRLVVTGYEGKTGGLHRWECICDCGKTTIVGQTSLQSGKTKSCGCLGHPPVQDIQGQRFGELTAMEYVGKRDGQYYWRCQCSCGNEMTVRQNNLIIGKTKSCGCIQVRIVTENMKLVDGTSVTMLEKAGQRLASNNSSGYNGVYFNRKNQKWTAQIGFKGKTYYLGSYHKIEDAVKARRNAEDRIYGAFLEWYYETHPKMTDQQTVVGSL